MRTGCKITVARKPLRRNVPVALRRMGRTLGKFKEVQAAYVLGSFLERRDYEDVDVAVLLARRLPPAGSLRLAGKLAWALEEDTRLRHEFDVKFLDECPLNFQHKVIRDGLVVFCRDNEMRVRFEARVLSEYMDFQPTSEWLDRQFLSKA